MDPFEVGESDVWPWCVGWAVCLLDIELHNLVAFPPADIPHVNRHADLLTGGVGGLVEAHVGVGEGRVGEAVAKGDGGRAVGVVSVCDAIGGDGGRLWPVVGGRVEAHAAHWRQGRRVLIPSDRCPPSRAGAIETEQSVGHSQSTSLTRQPRIQHGIGTPQHGREGECAPMHQDSHDRNPGALCGGHHLIEQSVLIARQLVAGPVVPLSLEGLVQAQSEHHHTAAFHRIAHPVELRCVQALDVETPQHGRDLAPAQRALQAFMD
mmetsp:Transcript_30791/g.76432  ORF Transcript_30791/g.76432 Transcript_30791/m.76432 type:complete len:264 (+) Transcript_30791:560-1351(+)